MNGLRVGFVTGSGSFWRHRLLAAKYRVQRLSGSYTPDVYALPRFLGDRCTFIRNGQPVAASEFDLIFSELNGGDAQLEYLDSLIAAQSPPVAVIPGPPEIMFGSPSHQRLLLARRIILNARYVLAYSEKIAAFFDGLVGRPRAQLIPWPFDYDATRRLAGSTPRPAETVRVVLNVPLCFNGPTRNFPFLLKAGLMDALAALPAAQRERLSFHSFVYSGQDRNKFAQTGFAEGLPLTLERRRHYGSFVRFLESCDAVINMTSSNILGRITFLAAALGKPGIFTSNAGINVSLYPGSTVALLDPAALREGLIGLLTGLVGGNVPTRFLPDSAAAMRLGDFSANALVFRQLFSDL